MVFDGIRKSLDIPSRKSLDKRQISPRDGVPKLPRVQPPQFETLDVPVYSENDDGEVEEEQEFEEFEFDEDMDLGDAEREPDSQDEQKTFDAALECVYLPIHSQIEQSFSLPTCSDLFNCLKKAFRYNPKLIERSWKNVQNDCFPSLTGQYNQPIENSAKDVVLDLLRQRKNVIEKDLDPFYTKNSFQTDKEFVSWKKETLSIIDAMTASANAARTKRFESKARVNVEGIRLGKNKTLFGISSSMEVLYKLKTSAQSEKDYLLESKSSTGDIDRDSDITFEVDFEEEFITTNVDLSTILTIRFYYKSFKVARFAQVDIKLSDFISKIEPLSGCWGRQQFTEEFEILSSENNHPIGFTTVTINLQYQKFPQVAVQSKPYRDTTNYQELFQILINRLLSSKKINSTNMPQDGSLFDYSESWIIQEYCSRYNISEVTKRLCILTCLQSRPDLLSACSNYFKQGFDFLHANQEHSFCHTTKSESKKFHQLLQKSNSTLETILQNIQKYIKRKFKSKRCTRIVINY
ncbi:guaAB [Acrasis kona]|uniref:GuaAB n=1 Tax=Acrasis kona TaxID=1008807 RepID=A0AAW2YUG6_9EUKA